MLKNLAGRRICIYTLGCRTNQYEGEALACSLVDAGAVLSEGPGCDAAVLVSCTVTSIADSKCRQVIRRIRRHSPEAIVAVCGCWAQRVPESEARRLGVRLLVGNRRKAELPKLLAECLSGGEGFVAHRGEVANCEDWDGLFLARPLIHTRAFVKVQEGCDQFCSYCAVPLARGLPVSRPADEVVREVRSIVASGCREVVITGVHLALYGRNGETSLAGLMRRIASVEGLARIRMGSIEPPGVDSELLEVLAGAAAFQPHLHIPLQSGDDRVLKLMNRGYSARDYLDVLRRVRSFLGDEVHISTDLMVGFPGEDEEAFASSMAFIREGGFGKVHVFPYSPREGTRAFHMPGRVHPSDVSSRAEAALALGRELLEGYCGRWVGREETLLVESASPVAEGGVAFEGLTRHFLRAACEAEEGDSVRQGGVLRVLITGAADGTLKGRLAG
ncbi:MAG: tRNA (N(6)-L-threonylcarbamoyladenosine(37)-C(2))-methylthiotransferase MtaB [Synergistota bacterium]|nr:tRNA (N(6)-L-threonylcarbamoyladenosine(37)-C(2))-methylthiotransferase MtaB [Synergistota bacterium]OPZ41037.1 MAG: Threonylcarbamoyladenosine tRNA methylthiotransferase MtaB [Synergistetes bacterium ADurb.BinA166]